VKRPSREVLGSKPPSLPQNNLQIDRYRHVDRCIYIVLSHAHLIQLDSWNSQYAEWPEFVPSTAHWGGLPTCWPLHDLVITNVVWCRAYKREVKGGLYNVQ